MLDVAGALYAALINDAPTAALLATYDDAPAVFTGDAVPGDAEPPFLVIDGSQGETPLDDKTTRAREVIVAIEVHAERTGSSTKVDTLARTVLAALHRKPFAIDGGTMLVSDVSGPSSLGSGDELVSRLLQVRMLIDQG